MGKYDDINRMCDEMISRQREFADEILRVMNDETSKAMTEAYKKFGEEQKKAIEDIFNDAVSSFYDDYTPKIYKERQYGLYDLLSLRYDERGMVENGNNGDYEDFFDESKLHTDRHGGSLYELTFLEGWHGGAKTISTNKAKTWGSHPSKGTPYYRTGGYVILNGKRVWHKYGAWGRQAKQTTPSPYEKFRSEMISAEGGSIYQMFKTISDKYNDEAMKIVNNKMSQLHKKIYGI